MAVKSFIGLAHGVKKVKYWTRPEKLVKDNHSVGMNHKAFYGHH
jgi:hypothetical protein